MSNSEYFEFEINDKILQFIGMAIVFLGVYFLSSGVGIFSLPELGARSGLLLVFITGVLTSFHCIGMCGGLVVTYATNNKHKTDDKRKKLLPHLEYNTAKLVSYTIMGALVGLVGSFFNFTGTLRGFMAIFAGGFMIIMGLNMLNIFPWLRRLTIRTPNVLGKVKKGRKGPLFLGLLTGLMPCGPLQAMLLFAAGTGSVLQGSLTMLMFGLGTVPMMFGFGSITSLISHKATKSILKFSAVVVLSLGVVMLNRGLVLSGSTITIETLNPFSSGILASAKASDGFQTIDMKVTRYGWDPDTFVVKKGIPVKWNIEVEEITYCNNEVVFPAFGINQKFSNNGERITLEFTPDKKGKFPFTCWMGMIPGMIIVE
ncbi:MAG: sulfite exporter TauE/SafE family protein [Candidatus Aenigmarchaeota archaeon]|nr:sulfite exporter TauE/SafE family protein [Candidatus Aenigmarchaeota archaeon]